MGKNAKKGSLKYFLMLHIIVFIYSLSGICSKIAAQQKFMSPKFCLCYAGIIAVLGIYAIAWQQVLKHINLTTAFCNKSAEMIWGILWGVLIFKETISWKMILGAVIVIIGVIIVVMDDE